MLKVRSVWRATAHMSCRSPFFSMLASSSCSWGGSEEGRLSAWTALTGGRAARRSGGTADRPNRFPAAHHSHARKRHQQQRQPMAAQHVVAALHILERDGRAVAVVCKEGGRQAAARQAGGSLAAAGGSGGVAWTGGQPLLRRPPSAACALTTTTDHRQKRTATELRPAGHGGSCRRRAPRTTHREPCLPTAPSASVRHGRPPWRRGTAADCRRGLAQFERSKRWQACLLPADCQSARQVLNLNERMS